MERSVGLVSSPDLDSALERMPHRPPMRLISRLVRVDAAASTYEAEAEVRADNPFLRPGGLERVALAEMLAQTFAAGAGLEEDGPPRPGYLVGLRDVRFHDDARLGDRLRIRVRLETRITPFVLLAGEVYRLASAASQETSPAETLLAEGQIRLFLPPEGTGV